MLQSFSLKRRVDGQKITNAVYVAIFSYLILFSIFNSLYLDVTPASENNQPDHYEVENVTIKPVGCSFFISGYYERTPRYICYLLLVFTIVIRNHKWLAAGAAASVLTYSGVAAIHLIILFATNDRLNLPKAKLHCESLPIPGASAPFLACAGVNDPDVALSMTIVSSVMLGALPVVAWSTTFKRSTSKAILIFWLLLLAVGHTFYALTTTSRPSLAFQICPQDHMEPLPRASYQAPLLDQSWRDSFSSVVSSSQSPRNGSSPACIYSCFATAGYIGRKPEDITVWDGVAAQHPFQKSAAAHRRGGVIFWWAYTFLAFLTLFTTEKKGRLPKWSHMPLFSIEYRQRPPTSRWKWKWKPVPTIAIKATKDPITTTASSEPPTSVKIHITVLKAVQLFTQAVSVVAFCGSIIIQEANFAQGWSELSQEPFVAVGQWSNLAVVLLVLVAAGVSRIWAWSRGTNSLNDDHDANHDYWGDEDADTERGDWDWRIGYAS